MIENCDSKTYAQQARDINPMLFPNIINPKSGQCVLFAGISLSHFLLQYLPGKRGGGCSLFGTPYILVVPVYEHFFLGGGE